MPARAIAETASARVISRSVKPDDEGRLAKEIRNPKSEIRKKSEHRIPKSFFATAPCRAFGPRLSGFGLLSDFGFRISDFIMALNHRPACSRAAYNPGLALRTSLPPKAGAWRFPSGPGSTDRCAASI